MTSATLAMTTAPLSANGNGAGTKTHFVAYAYFSLLGRSASFRSCGPSVTSLRTPNTNVYIEPFTWLPHPPHFGNYVNGWDQTNFGAAMLRSYGISAVPKQ